MMKASSKLMIPTVGILIGGVLYVGIRKVCQSERSLFFLVSRMLERLQDAPLLKSRDVRQTFRVEAVPSAELVDGHSHGISARDRNMANKFCRQFAYKLGRKCFSYQMSSSDQYVKVPGYRDWRWTKDLSSKPCNNPETGISYMVDVDYYVDMNKFLAGKREPVLIFTTLPSKVASSSGDTVHYFNKDNELVTRVAGGATFQHKLWDYNCDSLVAVKKIFGITYCVTHFLVDLRHVSNEKKLVLFTPVGTWRGVSSWIANWWLDGTELKRLQPVTNGWASLYSLGTDGLSVSVGRAGTYGEASVPASVLENMLAADRLSKQNANVGSVASWAESDRTKGVIIADYIRENKTIKAPYVANISSGVIGYSADLTGDDNDKTTIEPFMPALVSGGCFAPSQDKKTTTWGVESRVTNLKQLRSLPINKLNRKRARQFVKRVVGDTVLCPVDFEAVRDNQTRTTQRAILDEAANTGSVIDSTINSFMKREAYAKVGTPRVISTLPGLTKLEYSQYTLAASKHVKTFSWYAFKKPGDIAARVAEIVNGQELVAETDFSRMDGHVTEEVRKYIEEPIMLGLFGNDDYMLFQMREQYGKNGQLGGKKYETGYARASGSPETSLFNTILTAFISFSAMCDLGLDYEQAWKSLGVYGGDDGLVAIPRQFSADQADAAYRRSATTWGQVLKLDFKKSGEPVQFLARFYGTAWSGGQDSMSDVKRQLVKFHTTISMDVNMSPEQKAVDKAIAILLTDKNTPILGEFARKVATVDVQSRVEHDQAFRMTSHWASFDREDQFPNEYGIWMDDVVSSQMPDFDLELFKDWITYGDPMKPPQCLDLTPETHQPEITCIINDDIVPGKGIQPSKTIQASPEPKQDENKIRQVKRSTHKRTSETIVSKKTSPVKVNNQSKKPTRKNEDETISETSTKTNRSASRRQRQRVRKAQGKKATGDCNVSRRSNH